MPTKSLEKAIQQAAEAFAQEIVEAVTGASLQELIALQTATAAPKRKGRKPGPKPGAKRSGRKPGRPPKAAKRLSRADKAQVLDTIVDYLKKNPASKTPAIAKSVGIPSRRAGLYLKELREKRRVTSTGKKVNMVYSAKTTTKKVAKKPTAKKTAKKTAAKK